MPNATDDSSRAGGPALAAGAALGVASAVPGIDATYRQLKLEEARQQVQAASKGIPRKVTDIRAARGAEQAAEAALEHALLRNARYGVPLGAAATGVTGYGLYQRYFDEGKTAALHKLGLGMDLKFDTQQQAQDHLKNRDIGAAAGTAIGAGLGAKAGMRRGGVGGMIAGTLLGSVVGNPAGRVAADVVHDVPDRTRRMYNDSQQRMGTAAGIRIASADRLESFPQGPDPVAPADEEPDEEAAIMPPRTGDPSWGAVSHAPETITFNGV